MSLSESHGRLTTERVQLFLIVQEVGVVHVVTERVQLFLSPGSGCGTCGY